MGQKSKAMTLVKNLLDNHYKEVNMAKERGELVGWSTSIFPQEIAETFGLHVLYPENHAAAVAAKHESLKVCEVAESKGYSIDICSYARVNLGYVDLKKIESINMPQPDFILCCNNICNTVIKWYENIAKELNIPMILMDTPFNSEYEITQERIDYFKGQLQEAIRKLEEITGKKFDQKRFEEVMKISTEAGNLWKESMSLTKAIPAPMNGFEMFNYMAVIVCARGKKETVEIFKTLIDELQERIDKGETSYRGEQKHRIMFEGIPCWPYLSYKLRSLNDKGINMVGSVYTDAWALQYESNDLDGMAKAYCSIMNNVNLDRQVDMRAKVIRDFKCDGAIYHMNRSCKLMDFMQYELERRVEAKTNVPYIGFDGDQADPRNFTKAQFETRVQGLAEVMEERKNVGGVKHE
ncbi:2-hydroxyacyl-CoA dehydratase subunit D [Clostridium botulinum]|uniref:2-hydroxyglutaryl-CoA dehydratase n=1 Tax=Clostridium botulinum TaxID=1491 RepID=A0A9Q1UYY3_CLOBO|nr:(R)-2-hydroxyglutaryl-CoA dehydratase, alpha subunit family [Clostridium botulinum BKT015925]KEI02840.1 2-hydroxyglutaryl-CoA dehydratase [Clostridium botulinum C/D str. Sp77]KLU75143.1 2-hydroxyglutaryl-CoA dehydratase [Clostridium botulinum V891]KOA72878.1 2-hydroxyglutaryl-CoA dehydratase [Clostridium botulinum]MCD3196886.1 2-hydroxyacyl-CoA dehydratase [Clostridium botulinum C/D]